jgi:hypothetical protein
LRNDEKPICCNLFFLLNANLPLIGADKAAQPVATTGKKVPIAATVEIGPELTTLKTSEAAAKIWWPQRVLHVPDHHGKPLEIEQGRVRVLTFNMNVMEVVRVETGCCGSIKVWPLDEKTIAVLGEHPGRFSLQVITELFAGDKAGFSTNFNVAVIKPIPVTGKAEGISEIGLTTNTGLVSRAVSTSLILRADGSSTTVEKIREPGRNNWQVATRSGTFSPDDFGRLAEYLRQQGFFQMNDRYPSPATDGGRTSISVTQNQIKKTVESDGGSGPFELWSIEKAFKRIADTIKWGKVETSHENVIVR